MKSNVVALNPERVRIWERDPKDRFLILHKPTGMYYVRAKRKGKKPLFKKTGFTQKGKAKTKALILLAEWMGKGRKQADVTIEYACDWILENYTPKRRIGTQRGHQIYLEEIKNHIGWLSVDEVTPATLYELINSIKGNKRYSKHGKPLPARKTYFDYAKFLNLIMRVSYNNRWSTHLVKFESPDKSEPTGRLITRMEISALWDQMDEDLRDKFVLSFECFMRLREVICAPWSEVNLETGEWVLPPDRVKTGSQTNEGRSFFVSPNALERLRARYARRNRRSPWIFPSPTDEQKPIWSIKTAWSSAKSNARIKGRCRWHDLRHTSLTWALLGDPDASDEDNRKMMKDPILVSVYAGVSMRTIQTVYLKKRAEQTKSVSGAIKLF